MAATVTRIHTAAPRTLRGSAEAFLDTLGPGNTRRAYGIAVVKTVDHLDSRDPDGLPGPGLGLRLRDRRGPGISLGHSGGQYLERAPSSGSEMAVLVPRARLGRPGGTSVGRALDPAGFRDTGAVADRDRPAHLPPRDPSAGEDTVEDAVRNLRSRRGLLQLNIEDLDLAGRRARVKSKGAKPRTRRRGAAHHEHVLETAY
ncbi:hypothetical protein [Nocardia niigatensis]